MLPHEEALLVRSLQADKLLVQKEEHKNGSREEII